MASSKIILGSLVAIALVAACGGSADSGATATGAGGSSTSSGGSGDPSDGLEFPGQTGSDGSGVGNGSAGGVCAAKSTQATLQPVYLGVAFDVSGSMGKLDFPYHDPKLKWEPIVAATKSFFNDTQSTGISASLTFFPIDADSDARCDPNSYDKPDVSMTKLPSAAFGSAIDAITPQTPDEWRGGTPTLAAVTGSLGSLEPLVQSDPSAKYAVVLITDGYPQGCDDDSITSVTKAVAAVAASIPTFVIGVKNPAGGPDTVTNLDAIAVAGGTKQAFIVQTGDPEQTKADFAAVIDGIRKQSISCETAIPPAPDGEKFDPKKVNVTYTTGANQTLIGYDQACASENAWQYDDPAAPKSIVLCDGTCKAVQADAATVLHVEFGCETINVPK